MIKVIKQGVIPFVTLHSCLESALAGGRLVVEVMLKIVQAYRSETVNGIFRVQTS